ncbi:MAG: 4-(cytidine 5'-diphospho)-2-C-methyl-D-erythritol kinase [Oscillospiraceae bacterium]|nr:4-(cytidine 5'-diphospho)-2-C-methyl-D-erythritol kinase [Oscillospiraceae bacterium]
MTTLREHAYAKLNLTLDILDRRPDGYHNLSMIMQPITLCNELEITLGTGAPWQVRCSDPVVPTGEKNLACKSARVFYGAAGTDPDGLTVEIHKRIPTGAGLGGGSADAAAVLRALNRHAGSPFTQKELEALAEEVGSDVPFCIGNRTCLVEGRGEKLTPVAPMPACYYVLVQPGFPVATEEMYQQADRTRFPARPKNDQMRRALEQGDLREIGCQMLNVFSYVLMPAHPELLQIMTALENCGALGASMTGSGSVIFGVFENFDFAATASMSLMQVGYQTFLATNVAEKNS